MWHDVSEIIYHLLNSAIFKTCLSWQEATWGVPDTLPEGTSLWLRPWTYLNPMNKPRTLNTKCSDQLPLAVLTDSGIHIEALPVTSRSLEKGNYGLLSLRQRNCEDAPPIRANCNFKHALFNDAARSVQLTLGNTLTGQSQECPVEPRGNISAFGKISDLCKFEHTRYKSRLGLFIILTVEKPKYWRHCSVGASLLHISKSSNGDLEGDSALMNLLVGYFLQCRRCVCVCVFGTPDSLC